MRRVITLRVKPFFIHSFREEIGWSFYNGFIRRTTHYCTEFLGLSTGDSGLHRFFPPVTDSFYMLESFVDALKDEISEGVL